MTRSEQLSNARADVRRGQLERMAEWGEWDSVREPLPSLTFSLTGMALHSLVGLGNLLGVILPGGPPTWLSAFFVLTSVMLVTLSAYGYKRRLAERAEVREKNLDRVDEWIISTDLFPPSPELAKIEADLANAYRQMMAAKGRDTKGRTLPDPNSNNSRKRQARRARAAKPGPTKPYVWERED